mgnify:CR=1 FL=1
MTCSHVGSGCNAPEGECLGFCLNKGYEVQYKTGTKLTDRESGAVFVVSGSNSEETQYQGASGRGTVKTSEVAVLFEVDAPEAVSVLDIQEGGDHYKKLGAYQPWEVLRHWLTPEEFRGYMKGTAIAYLAREQDKGGMLDIRKAGHTLQGLVELLGAE